MRARATFNLEQSHSKNRHQLNYSKNGFDVQISSDASERIFERTGFVCSLFLIIRVVNNDLNLYSDIFQFLATFYSYVVARKRCTGK